MCHGAAIFAMVEYHLIWKINVNKLLIHIDIKKLISSFYFTHFLFEHVFACNQKNPIA